MRLDVENREITNTGKWGNWSKMWPIGSVQIASKNTGKVSKYPKIHQKLDLPNYTTAEGSRNRYNTPIFAVFSSFFQVDFLAVCEPPALFIQHLSLGIKTGSGLLVVVQRNLLPRLGRWVLRHNWKQHLQRGIICTWIMRGRLIGW